ANHFQVGRDYDAIGLDLQHAHKSPAPVKIDEPVRKRLSERARVDRAAAREGMAVGTLVEADFESFTARLRRPTGQAVTVSFDPSLSDSIHAALREPATIEGWVTYDPGTQQARSINVRSVRRAEQIMLVDTGAFREHRTFKELQAAQG